LPRFPSPLIFSKKMRYGPLTVFPITKPRLWPLCKPFFPFCLLPPCQTDSAVSSISRMNRPKSVYGKVNQLLCQWPNPDFCLQILHIFNVSIIVISARMPVKKNFDNHPFHIIFLKHKSKSLHVDNRMLTTR
jgi:hypothetical protein